MGRLTGLRDHEGRGGRAKSGPEGGADGYYFNTLTTPLWVRVGRTGEEVSDTGKSLTRRSYSNGEIYQYKIDSVKSSGRLLVEVLQHRSDNA